MFFDGYSTRLQRAYRGNTPSISLSTILPVSDFLGWRANQYLHFFGHVRHAGQVGHVIFRAFGANIILETSGEG